MTADLTPGGIPRAGEGQEPTGRGADEPSPLSRRQALQRLGQGVAGGAVVGAAWLTPEILIGRPTAAGASSAAPGGAGAGGGGTSDATGTGGGSAGTGGGAPSQTASPAAAQWSGSSGQLAFTGLDVERVLEAGAGLLVGGWMLTRWSGGRDGDAPGKEPTGENPSGNEGVS